MMRLSVAAKSTQSWSGSGEKQLEPLLVLGRTGLSAYTSSELTD